jgi:hypothetical protein
MNRAHVRCAVVAYCSSNYSSILAAVARRSWVIGADVQAKLFVTPQLKVPHHFIERFSIRCTGRVEDPAALGAAKTSKMLLLNPLQLPNPTPLSR